MRLFVIGLLLFVTGCSVTRSVTVNTRPPGARIDVDGSPLRREQHTVQLTWDGDEAHNITAELPGFRPETVQLRRDDPQDDIMITLKPLSRAFTINVVSPNGEPLAATIKINDQPVSSELRSTYTTPRELDVSRDPATGRWKEYTIVAQRDGFKPASATLKWADNKTTYNLVLQPMEKEFSVTTVPSGATVYLDGDLLGTSPIDKVSREFPYDVTTNQFAPHTLKATLPGYPPREEPISYDDGRSSYEIRMQPSKKSLRIHTDPPGGIVTLDGQQYKPEANGDTVLTLAFPPVPGTNDLKIYSGVIHKPKTANQEWYDEPITIKWDDGKKDYEFPLREIRTVKLPLVSVDIEHGENGWAVAARSRDTIAGKSRAEPSGPQPVSLTPAEMKGKNIDALAISPDGRKLLFTVLEERPTLHSLMYIMPSDGSGPPMPLNAGNSLELTPSFSPDGEQILFSSDRMGNRLIICARSANGGQAVEQYTIGQTTDWWPSMDSSPRPRLFYEARSDRMANPTICSKLLDTPLPADLNVEGGMKPRINAQNDSILYECYNVKTRKRDLWRMSDSGANRVNLTNTPDDDEHDAAWDRVGAQIAFASDQGVDEEKNHNYDIWVMDVTQPNAVPQRITSNPSHDDHPVWDPSSKAIYFRSNRGGEWGIWKIMVK